MIDAQENARRQQAIEEGPWSREAALAMKTVALTNDEWKQVQPASVSERVDLKAVGRKLRKSNKFQKKLAAHWEEDIEGDDLIAFRGSFDEALTTFQLYELAIETSFVDLEPVRETIREALIRLLYADAARQYLVDYDYHAVRFLAARVDVDLNLPPVAPPAVVEGDEVRFASFLSQHHLWYAPPGATDEAVDRDRFALTYWLDFLDDYVEEIDDMDARDAFYAFLKKPLKTFDDEDDLWNLLEGADYFVALLANLDIALTSEERPRYGAFYAYWMARFFGFELGKKGYKKKKSSVDWAELIRASERIAQAVDWQRASHDPTLGTSYTAILGNKIKRVSALWKGTEALLSDTRVHAKR